MTTWNFSLPWYHDAQEALTTLRIGSSITQNRDIARIFSHRSTITSIEDDGSLKHNGAVATPTGSGNCITDVRIVSG